MKIIIVKDAQEGGQKGFEVFKATFNQGANVFGLATGSTPITTYDVLINSNLDFSNKISINLDEYVGLAPEQPQSYHFFMQQHLFNYKPFAHSYLPNGLNPDAEGEATRYEQIIADNPIDLQILGLGQNGHIGFNEPGTPLDSKTHEVSLTKSTIEANARFFTNQDDVPRTAYSMGIGTILKAKQILLEAYGENKAAAVQKMIEGPVSTDVPASVLQRHQNVMVILDVAAAKNLREAE